MIALSFKVRALSRQLVEDRLQTLALARLTLDFNGSVIHTRRHAEGSAVGYCQARKGARSYYPLFCTVAQTGQVFDLLHRPGNVHDSRGAQEFLTDCLGRARALCPAAQLEVRLDSAFFSAATLTTLEPATVEYTISVPFERFVELKGLIEARRRWRRIDGDLAYFELEWKPQRRESYSSLSVGSASLGRTLLVSGRPPWAGPLDELVGRFLTAPARHRCPTAPVQASAGEAFRFAR